MHAHTQTHWHTHKHKHTYNAHTLHTHMCIHKHTDTHIHNHTHTHIHNAQAHTHSHANACTLITITISIMKFEQNGWNNTNVIMIFKILSVITRLAVNNWFCVKLLVCHLVFTQNIGYQFQSHREYFIKIEHQPNITRMSSFLLSHQKIVVTGSQLVHYPDSMSSWLYDIQRQIWWQ